MSFLTQKRYLHFGYKKEEAYTAHWTVAHNQAKLFPEKTSESLYILWNIIILLSLK